MEKEKDIPRIKKSIKIKDDNNNNNNIKENIEHDSIKEEIETAKKSPLSIIIGLFLIMIIMFMSIPYYAVRMDPEPQAVPLARDVISIGNPEEIDEIEHRQITYEDYPKLVRPDDSAVKSAADKIVEMSGCKSSKTCQAKALFYFVRDSIIYISDPVGHEYVKTAIETLSTGGDCDDKAVALANLLEAIGIRTRFVFITGHVYIEAYMPDAPRKYRHEGWVSMDAACEYCGLGEIAIGNNEKNKKYVE